MRFLPGARAQALKCARGNMGMRSGMWRVGGCGSCSSPMVNYSLLMAFSWRKEAIFLLFPFSFLYRFPVVFPCCAFLVLGVDVWCSSFSFFIPSFSSFLPFFHPLRPLSVASSSIFFPAIFGFGRFSSPHSLFCSILSRVSFSRSRSFVFTSPLDTRYI